MPIRQLLAQRDLLARPIPLRDVVALVALIVAAFFAWFIWPSPWYYGTAPDGTMARISRFSDEVQYFRPQTGWVESNAHLTREQIVASAHTGGYNVQTTCAPDSATAAASRKRTLDSLAKATDPFRKIGDVPP